MILLLAIVEIYGRREFVAAELSAQVRLVQQVESHPVPTETGSAKAEGEEISEACLGGEEDWTFMLICCIRDGGGWGGGQLL